MRLRRPGAWQRVVALAPLLLLLASLPSQVLMRCRMDGLLRDSCCCPRTSDATPAGPTVSGTSCCNSETTVSNVPVVRTTANPDVTPTLVAVSLPSPGPEAELRVRSIRPAAPAREGPPLLLLKQAFLI